MGEESQSYFKRFLNAIDVFTYVPIPQAYPVSTNKSKIGSVIFLCLLVGYLIYDFYKFVVSNVPTLNSYAQSTVNNGFIELPEIAFGMLYYDPVRVDTYMLNNNSYFDFQMESIRINAFAQDDQPTFTYKTIPLRYCGKGDWANSYYLNMSCLELDPKFLASQNMSLDIINQNGRLYLQNPYFKTGQVTQIILTLSLYWCQFSSFLTPCATQQQIKQVLQTSKLVVLMKQALGYDYRSGTQIFPDNVEQLTIATLRIGYDNREDYKVEPTRFIISPNFLTTFTTVQTQYSKIKRDKVVNASVGTFYTFPLTEIRFQSSIVMNVVQIHHQTLIDRISQWSAFSGFVFMIAALCFLGYNRNKFNKRNPDWQRFDQMLKQRLNIQMKSINNKKNDDDTLSYNGPNPALQTPLTTLKQNKQQENQAYQQYKCSIY